MKYFMLAARLIIGGIFIYASIHKILEPAQFAVAVRNYQLVPSAWTHLVALTLPWIEIGAGICLILGIQTRASALLTTGMLSVFLAAVVYAYAIGLDIDCGCFTSGAASKGRIDMLTIARDAGVLLISVFILAAERGDFSVARVSLFGDRLRFLNA
jgi:putative oxidoreductase